MNIGKSTYDAIVGYLKRNPGEDLSIEEVAAKCSISQHTAGRYLSSLSGDGILERVSVYRIRESAPLPDHAHGSVAADKGCDQAPARASGVNE